MHDLVLYWLDKLDDYWSRHAASPDLRAWIGQINDGQTETGSESSSSENQEICEELLRADLNWRLRSTTSHPGETLVVSQLLDEFGDIATPSQIRSLLRDEYVFRSRSSVIPYIPIIKRLIQGAPNVLASTVTPASLEILLLSALIDENPIIVKLDTTDNNLMNVPESRLQKSLDIGRAHESEFTTTSILDDGHSRMVIADCREVTVSRKQVRITRKDWCYVTVANVSNKVPIFVGDSRRVSPGKTLDVSIPFSIAVGRFRIVAQQGP